MNEAASRQKKPEIVRKDKLGHRAWVHLEVNPILNWELHALRRPKADDQHARVRPSSAAKKESGSLVRGTEKSDRIAAVASAEIEVCAGTVLPGSSSAKPQAADALPQ